MAALPDLARAAGAAALADADGWMLVGPKGLRQRRSAAPVAPAEPGGAAALGGPLGGFALLEGLSEEAESEEDTEEAEAEAEGDGEENGEAKAEAAAAEEDGAAVSPTASSAGPGPEASTLNLPGRRKRLLDGSILRCPQRSLVADVMALYRRRAAARADGCAARAAVHADSIKASFGGAACLALLCFRFRGLLVLPTPSCACQRRVWTHPRRRRPALFPLLFLQAGGRRPPPGGGRGGLCRAPL